MRRFIFVVSLGGVLLLAGCMGFNPVVDTVLNQAAPAPRSYVRGFEYLEVRAPAGVAAMALGARDKVGDQVHEYWYSGQREMVHMVNGRIHEVIGMTHEVRHSAYEAPSWAALTQSDRPLIWSQTKDVMPSYQYGLTEFVISQRVEPTTAEKKLVTQDAVWVEEEVKGKRADGGDWIYRQKFALGMSGVVYSMQCIAPDLCFEFKPLGVMLP